MSKDPIEKIKCPDCHQCQMCNKSRCRLCQKSVHTQAPSQLGTAFTHGQYLEWKRKKEEVRNG